MQKLIIIISLFFTVGLVNAQQENLDKAEKAIDDGYFERAYKLTSEAIENEQTKKNPLSYYLCAISLFELSKDEYHVKKNPETFKDACKMIVKAKQRDKDKKYDGKFDVFTIYFIILHHNMYCLWLLIKHTIFGGSLQ